MVNIDGLTAICPNLNCDYAYVAASASVTSQSYDNITKILTVSGTTLPTTGLTVIFGGASCSSTPTPIFTSTQIKCTLANAPTAGSFSVQISNSNGILPLAGNVAAIATQLVVSTISPLTTNPYGGGLLTITGSGFPIVISAVTISFDDGTGCTVLSSTLTQITC